ncbi:unnamed protein product [Dovyalis caffra]|uniref:Uncharacterized protein n=1 Tax=Dovyalis caffra TaxID=77055 RepID=A0AAV1SXD3_9ROSI|nr:unnamed protein product [Dovyalis caffra]
MWIPPRLLTTLETPEFYTDTVPSPTSNSVAVEDYSDADTKSDREEGYCELWMKVIEHGLAWLARLRSVDAIASNYQAERGSQRGLGGAFAAATSHIGPPSLERLVENLIPIEVVIKALVLPYAHGVADRTSKGDG